MKITNKYVQFWQKLTYEIDLQVICISMDNAVGNNN